MEEDELVRLGHEHATVLLLKLLFVSALEVLPGRKAEHFAITMTRALDFMYRCELETLKSPEEKRWAEIKQAAAREFVERVLAIPIPPFSEEAQPPHQA